MKSSNAIASKINVTLIWGAIVVTAGVITYAFENFVEADELETTVKTLTEKIETQTDSLTAKLEAQQLRTAYGQYYDRLDDYDEALTEGNDALAAEYARQMETLRAEICKLDPAWERCD